MTLPAAIDMLPILFATLLVLFLPGWAWQAWRSRPERDALENLGEAAAVSMAATAVVALAAFLLRVSWTASLLVAVYAALLVVALAGWLRRSRRGLAGLLPVWVALLFFTGMCAWRLFQARELALPAWVDSVHHTLIVRVFLERGGLTADLLPYLPVPLSYHYAFHALAADFVFWSGLSLDQAVLIFGQIVNAAVGLSVYRLGKAVWGDAKRALAAALLVTFFAHMPAYYLTWGRYTLLTGLIVMPVAMACALDVSRKPAASAGWARLALLTAGTLLAHYLAAILLAVFYMLLGLARLWADWRQRKVDWAVWRPLLRGAGVGLLIALPWLWRVWQYSRWGFRLDLVAGVNEPDQVYFADYLNYLGYLLGPARNTLLIAMGGLGLLLGLARKPARPLAAWALFIGLQTIPWGLRLGPFRPDHLAIVWFLPLALLAGDLLVSGIEALRALGGRRWAWAAAVVLVFGLGYWGMKETRSVLNPVTVLADEADRRAVAWIGEHTPPDARFWINTAAWQGGTYRGVDGGWWIQPLTGRSTLVPPAVYPMGSRAYVAEIDGWAERASQVSACSDDFWALVDEVGLTYVYLHAGKGALQPDALQGCPRLDLIYQQGDVWLYQISLFE